MWCPVTRCIRRALAAAVVLVLAGCATPPDGGGSPVAAPQPKAANKLAEVQTELGIGYLREGNLEFAFDRLTRALDADPSYSRAHNAMGTLQERLGNTQEAETHFRRAVSLNATDSSAQINYGSLLCRTGRYEEGEQRFLQALKNSLYERPEVAYNNAGLCMQAAGDLDKAESYFRSALQRNPRMPAALLGMANISFQRGRYLPARAYLQRFEEVAPLDAQSLWLGVQVERQLGGRDAEQAYARQLRQGFPDAHETGLLERATQ
jgi:type IV pilus assembly protein PilF